MSPWSRNSEPRLSAYESGGRGFESSSARQFFQWVKEISGWRRCAVSALCQCEAGKFRLSALLRRGRALLIEVEEAGDRKLESPCFWAKPIGRRFYLTSKSDGGHTSFPRFLHRMLSIQISKRLTMYSRPSISGYQPPSRSLTRGHVPVKFNHPIHEARLLVPNLVKTVSTDHSSHVPD